MSNFATRRTMMVDTQVRPSDVTKFPIIDAMLHVPREDFVPVAKREVAYIGENLEIAPGRALLEPRTFAKMLDALELGADDLVLDIGAGLGYSSAVMARICAAVIALEQDQDLASEAREALAAIGADNVIVEDGDLIHGAAEHAPFDAIIMQGAVEKMPSALEDQLKEGGKAISIFVDGALNEVRLGRKKDGRISWRRSFNASAPLLPGFDQEREFVL